MIVAIDGPAGTGKSTVARRVAEKASFRYLNSGLFYRAITWAALQAGIQPDDEDELLRVARSVTLTQDTHGLTVNGKRPGEDLRSSSVDAAVATLSTLPEIREIVNAQLHRTAAEGDVVAEGRDMATVVFPEAEVKVYLDASIEARARRRHDERNGRESFEEIRSAIETRDRIDKNKRVGRLKVDPGALYINTSDLTLHQVCDIVLRAILRKNQDNRSN